MIFTDFPITGQFRFSTMILEWIFAIICLEFSILFLLKYKKDKIQYSQNIGNILLFFTFSLKSILSVMGSYFSSNIEVIDSLHLISNIILYSGFLIFIFIKEKQRLYLFKKYFFSISLCILFLLFALFSILNNQLIIIESIIFLSFVYIFFILFYLESTKKAKTKSHFLTRIITRLVLFLFFLIGLFLTFEYSMELLDVKFRLIGASLQLFGIAFFALFFLKFPISSEIKWNDSIESIFLMNRNGICLFYKSYIKELGILDKDLITAAITTVNIMLKEIMKPESREIYAIKKKGKLVYIFPSDLIRGVIFAKKESKLIEFHLKQLVIRIEQVYQNVLENWDGELGIFNPIVDIFEEIFFQ